MEVIKTTKLTKYYGKARGIIDLDLSVEEGDFFGFIGPNGAGKSTTIRTLLGLLKPSGGRAEIFGKDIMEHRTEVLKEIGYLPSEAVFYPGMRVRDVLKLSAGLRKADCRSEMKKLCERFRLDMDKRVEELSFGNRKKTGIVCALQHRPKLLILDEPTSGLDPLMQREFFAVLQERKKEGTAVFLSSHILSEIQRNCTRAAIIREGRLVACDRVEILAKSNTKRVSVHGKVRGEFLPGIRDLQETEESSSFLYSGNIRELLSALAASDITDVTIAEPDLEEIFMHYYSEGNRK